MSLHLFGKKNTGRFHPHVNIEIIDKRGRPLMLSKSELAEVREQWRWALEHYLRHPVKRANVNFQYIKTYGQMLHRLRYMVRPMPGPEQYKALKGNLKLLHFCMVEMKGFHFVRYFNGSRSKGIADPTESETMEECRGVAGENLIFVPHGQITRQEFDEKYPVWRREELSPGFYRIRGP